MRTKWTFMFESEDLRFDKVVRYEVDMEERAYEELGLRNERPRIEIQPGDNQPNKVKQLGKINITIAGTPDETKDLAESLVAKLQSEIAFNYSGFKVLGSFVSSEMIPESPEEQATLGDARFGVTMKVVEVPPETTFEPGSIGKYTYDPLIDQFNAANQREHPIDAFIGFFKILEKLYGPSNRETLEQAFTKSAELRTLIYNNFSKVEGDSNRKFEDNEIDDLLKTLIRLRHESAHLKKNQFGLTYNDRRVDSEVRPYLDALREIVALAIVREKPDPSAETNGFAEIDGATGK